MEYIVAVGVFSGIIAGLSALLIVAERFLVTYAECEIEINGQEKIVVPGGMTILEALYENRIFIPSACGGRGTCGYCKVKVLDDIGPILPTEAPSLSRIEQAEGVRLACQVKVKQNIRLRIPEEYLRVQEYTARVTSSKYLTHDIKEIRLSLINPPEIEFRPGQYIQVKAPDPYGEFVMRAYSISSTPDEKNEIELIVRLVPGGIGSTYLHSLKPGDTVTFTGPFGEFVLDEDPETELVLVGGGCGMAPIKSIIYYALKKHPNRECWLFFGAREPRDVFYLEEYQQLAQKCPNFHVIYALSDLKEGQQWDGETGFIHLAVEKYLEAGREKRQAFLCGPPPMIEATLEVLEDKELEEDRIFYDKF